MTESADEHDAADAGGTAADEATADDGGRTGGGTATDEGGSTDEARMRLEPDALHEGDDNYYVDCPECGATASLEQIVFEGHCSGAVDEETAETEAGTTPQRTGCTADLALELVWSP